jgi:DNA-binding MarR family transcriptional regulator
LTHPTLDDTTALRAWRDQTLYRLLLRASRAETTATLARVHQLGYVDVSVSDTQLLANLDTQGTAMSALARRAGVTRQAASQRVAALERAGYVERRASENDGRVVVVHQTSRGRALLNDALDIVESLETAYAEQLGTEQLAVLKEALSLFLDRIDPIGVLGPT